jgi:hypothetical protein
MIRISAAAAVDRGITRRAAALDAWLARRGRRRATGRHIERMECPPSRRAGRNDRPRAAVGSRVVVAPRQIDPHRSMNLLQVAVLLVFAAAVGGYVHLFRRHQRQRLQRLREADARREAWEDALLPHRPRVRIVDRPQHAPSRRAPSWSWSLSECVEFIIRQFVWAVIFTAMLLIGVVAPGAVTLRLFHNADLLTQYPLTPASLFLAARYAFQAAAVMVLVGVLGLKRYGPFMLVFLAGLFACSLITALLGSGLVTMPVHFVVAPLWGIDVWNDWRPFVHLAFVALGVVWAFSIAREAHVDAFKDDPGYGGYRFGASPGTAAMAGGSLFSGLAGDSGGAGGSWSSGSDGGGDSD